MRAKEFLSGQGVEFQEVDVSRDAQAAQEMVMRTRQMGVPVIADDEEFIIGFDQPRLARMAARHRKGPALGMKVTDAKDSPDGGALVGEVKPGGPAEQAGVQAGDVVVELSGVPIKNVDDLAQVGKKWTAGRMTSLVVLREGERKTLFLR